MHNSDGIDSIYYSNGNQDNIKVDASDVAAAFEVDGDDVHDITESEELEHAVIHNEDSMMDTVKKVEILSKYKYESMYFYCGAEGEEQNMLFAYIYNSGSKSARKYKYDQNIMNIAGYKEKFSGDDDWTKRANVTRFDTTVMSAFKYDKIEINGSFFNIINCFTIDNYLKLLGDGDSVYVNNKFQVRTYFPLLRDNILILHNKKDQFEKNIKHEDSGLEFKSLLELEQKHVFATGLLNSDVVQELMEIDDSVTFYDCNIIESIVHINYELKHGAFVDVAKIFKMFPVTEQWPFSRLNTEKETNYYVYKSLTDKKSPHYVDVQVIKDWINPNMNKVINRNDSQAVIRATTFDRNVGRGVSFKILNYDKPEGRKYMTLNIYKDGKMELKCSWDEKFGTETNPGGTYELIEKAVEKVKAFVKELNMLQYHISGSKIQKIPEPTLDLLIPGGNTKVIFFNPVNMFNYGEIIDNKDLAGFIDHFNPYAHRVKNYIDDDTEDFRSLELRFTRVNNYIKLKSLHEHILNYKTHNKQDTKNASEYKKKLISDIAKIFGLAETEAAMALNNYEQLHEGKSGKKHARMVVSLEEMGNIMGRRINKQTGIRIKILKAKKDPADTLYKCLILGVNYDMLGPIHHFIKSVLHCYKYREILLTDGWTGSEPNYLELLLQKELQLEIDEDTIQEQLQQFAAIEKAKKAKAKKQQQQEEEEYDDLFLEEEEEDDIYLLEQEQQQEEQQNEEEEQVKAPPKKPVAVRTFRSFLNILQTKDKRYSENNYSRVCQKDKQPLLIEPSLAKALKEHVKTELARVTQELTAKPDDKDLKRELRELYIHKATLTEGAEYRGGFYFCPFTWNMTTSKDEDAQFAFPRYDDAVKGSDKMHYAKNWGAGKTVENLGGEKDEEAPHHWYLGFNMSLSNPPDNCFPCCFKTRNTKSKLQMRNDCLNTGSKQSFFNAAAKTSYVVAANKVVSENRYAFIDDKLNRIFNRNDKGKVLKVSNITTGFDYYLRKGVKKGNQFLNAIASINPKVRNIVEHLTDYLREVDDNINIFKSLKRGAINQVFLPTSDDTESLKIALSDTNIVLENFIAYLNAQSVDINEDFLWDLVTKPNCIIPTGFNLIICEVKFERKRSSNEVQLGIIKCPVGFDIEAMYSNDKPSMVLYHYGDHYEIICRVVSDQNGMHEYLMFEPGDPLIEEIINHVMSKCHTIPNKSAEKELKKHIKNVSFGKEDIIESVLLNDANPITSSQAKSLIDEMISSHDYSAEEYTISEQCIDHYNKVTHLVLANELLIPVEPSGIMEDIDIITSEHMPLPDYRDNIRLLVLLAAFENFTGYMPYAFLLDPGEDLDDPDDDIVIGIMLANGLLVQTDPILVKDVMSDPRGTSLQVTREVDGVQLAPVVFDMKQLLFSGSDSWQLWYDDYLNADKELRKPESNINDSRKIYSVRAQFEQETYQRLRYELTRYLDNKHDVADNIIHILDSKGSAASIRKDITEILKPIVKKLVISEESLDDADEEYLTSVVGPLYVGYNDLTKEDYLHEYTYIKPVIRYECFNKLLNKYRGEDPHCIKNKLYIPSVNLLTGTDGNVANYMFRVIEEVIRIPLKRREILENEMDNFVTDVHSYTDDAYYLSYTEQLLADLKSMYRSDTNYKERMEEHYDMANPENYSEYFNTEKGKELSLEYRCVNSFRNLPKFWIAKLKNMNWKYIEIQGPDNCVYNELDNIISIFIRDREVNTRHTIANIVTGKDFKSYDDRAAWEMARDHYAHIWREDYQNVNTKEELANTIKYSDRHHLYVHDLSLISREYNVKFIIISDKNPLSPLGITCLGTTQAVGDRYIILYQSSPYKFHIVKNSSYSPAKSVFFASELPEILFKEWSTACVADHKKELEPSNQIFLMAPVRAIKNPTTGHKAFQSTQGKLLAAPRQQIKLSVVKPGIVKPVKTVKTVKPIKASKVNPVKTVKPVKPVKIGVVNPVKPVRPKLKPVKPVKPTKPTSQVHVSIKPKKPVKKQKEQEQEQEQEDPIWKHTVIAPKVNVRPSKPVGKSKIPSKISIKPVKPKKK